MEKLTRRALSFSLGLVLAFPIRLFAASPAKDLEGIKKKIEKEKQGISQVRKKEGSILQSLGEIQGTLEKKTQELKQASAKLHSISAEMQRKEKEAANIRGSIAKRQEWLNRRAAALYRWHKSGSPFIILNGDMSLGKFLQRKRYLEATISYDRELVRRLGEESQRQQDLRDELARTREELDDQRKVISQAKDSVRKEAEKKTELLASLRREKESRVRALKELEQAAIRLQRMLDEISKRALSRPSDGRGGLGLAALRGKLDWPVKGALSSKFGKTRHPEFATEVFHNGIDIAAPVGQEIKAVEKGTVVFADRFSGYGKMIIIDHGERYYTIYAHLSELLKTKGDTVKRGETVGLVGDSDSLAGAKLYFEMRKDGRSVDPVPYFRKQ